MPGHADFDPWAEREGPFSFVRYVTDQPTAQFFVPYLKAPAEAEDLWSRLAAGDTCCRRVYSLTYLHDDQKIEVKVGEERKVFSRKKDRHGAYRPGLDFDRRHRREGTVVVAIVDAGNVLRIWSVAMAGRWPNPSLVSPADLERIQYFKPREP
jgi:hypothetical protein